MQNTKIEYSSDQQTPVVLPEMEQLLPPLSAEQFSALEADILENGCYGPIIVNEDMIHSPNTNFATGTHLFLAADLIYWVRRTQGSTCLNRTPQQEDG